MKKIMFICSGNTCRSPLAEGLFKKYLKENNITDIEVSSAGVGAFPGDAVSINSILVAGNRGLDISDHRARNINPEHLLTTDLFFCMSDSHKAVLSRYCDENKIVVLNVPDPYGRPIEFYEECAKQLESQFPQILERIQNTVVIREMTESDITEIADLEKECFSEPWSENSLRDELTNETARFYVLRDNENLLGYIGANNICNEVYITNVAVSGNCRGKGYGKTLVNHLIKQSETERAFFITLEVRKSNENAIKLYEKCGFKLIGERKNFYSKPQEDALIYTYYIEE
ncbi:MAG: ribosomal protein S18-alanine N-acetyltransferase [Clostridia bacterium]|nr:ribosomal protein S18-alanine N-acetyltransferase [Clostridia bacterium]